MKHKQEFIYHMAGTEKRSENTISGYVRDVEVFEKWLASTSGKELLEVTTDDIDMYTGYCTVDLKNASTTINKKLAGITKYYEYCVRKHGLVVNPAMRATRQKPKKNKPTYLVEEEVDKFLDAVKNDDRRGTKRIAKIRDFAMMKIFIACGLRVSELCNLKAVDIDFASGKLSVISGKGDKDREAHLGESTIKAIQEYMNIRDQFDPKDDELFINNHGNKFNCRTVNGKITSYCTVAGLNADKIHAHSLRHTFATIIVANGGRAEVLQGMMGHDDIKTTMKYVHIVESQEKETAKLNRFA